jgi:hypothetical protein
MSHFEYTFTGDLTSSLEDQTKNIITIVSNGNSPFVLQKYYDEEVDGKKTRTIILTSLINMVPHILNLFSGSKVRLQAYHKICLV